MKKYFQTWMYVSRLRKIPLLGVLFYNLIQFLCGLKGHELSKTEWGYSCDTCNSLTCHISTEACNFNYGLKEILAEEG